MTDTNYLTIAELETGLDAIRRSPQDDGVLDWIVRRPQANQREVLQEGRLDVTEGLVGDNWRTRGSSKTVDGSAHPEMQLNLMNSRAIALVARTKDRWALAGDQLFVDLDLSTANLPPGTRLAIGTAVIEITAPPHNGCSKFMARFGTEALQFVNSPVGRELHLRGIHSKVVRGGAIRIGDILRKL